MATLEIRDLHVSVDTEDGPKEILKGVTLTINEGETHAIMGPNGSGKSTLANVLMGNPSYKVTGGDVLFKGQSLLELPVDQRAILVLHHLEGRPLAEVAAILDIPEGTAKSRLFAARQALAAAVRARARFASSCGRCFSDQ